MLLEWHAVNPVEGLLLGLGGQRACHAVFNSIGLQSPLGDSPIDVSTTL